VWWGPPAESSTTSSEGTLDFRKTKFVVLDEADTMLDMAS